MATGCGCFRSDSKKYPDESVCVPLVREERNLAQPIHSVSFCNVDGASVWLFSRGLKRIAYLLMR
jgi:hypothetical protein